MHRVTDPGNVLIRARWNERRLWMVVVPVLLAVACIVETSFPSGRRRAASVVPVPLYQTSATLTQSPKHASSLTTARVPLEETLAFDLAIRPRVVDCSQTAVDCTTSRSGEGLRGASPPEWRGRFLFQQEMVNDDCTRSDRGGNRAVQ